VDVALLLLEAEEAGQAEQAEKAPREIVVVGGTIEESRRIP
jgi:hypothetical protein